MEAITVNEAKINPASDIEAEMVSLIIPKFSFLLAILKSINDKYELANQMTIIVKLSKNSALFK